MGYRDAWLNNSGSITRHYEVMLHALEREVPEQPLSMLLVDIDNGGPIELWRQVLPEGSEIVALDERPEAASLGAVIGDYSDQSWLRKVLTDRAFDVIIDRSDRLGEAVWPWLAPGGRLILEDPDPDDVSLLAYGVAHDLPSWLPVEEIMRLTVYPRVCAVEKRHPRVLPYIEIMTGNFSDLVPEQELIAQGVKRVLVN